MMTPWFTTVQGSCLQEGQDDSRAAEERGLGSRGSTPDISRSLDLLRLSLQTHGGLETAQMLSPLSVSQANHLI